MASYEFGFPIGAVSRIRQHTRNLLANVALDSEGHAHWRLIEFEATGISSVQERLILLDASGARTIRTMLCPSPQFVGTTPADAPMDYPPVVASIDLLLGNSASISPLPTPTQTVPAIVSSG